MLLFKNLTQQEQDYIRENILTNYKYIWMENRQILVDGLPLIYESKAGLDNVKRKALFLTILRKLKKVNNNNNNRAWDMN